MKSNKTKKFFVIGMSLVVILFLLVSCKTTTGTTTAATETTAAATTAAAATAAAETTVAAETTAAAEITPYTLTPDNLPAGWKLPKTLGHVTNYLMHEYYQNITKGEKAACDQYGIEFSINDANLDLQKSLAGLDDYVAKKTDVIVFTPVDEAASGPAVTRAREGGAIVVNEGNICDGMLTVVAINEYEAAYKTGLAAGEWLKANFSGKPVLILDVTLFGLRSCELRSNGFFDAIISILPDAQRVQVNGKGMKDEAVKVTADAITANPGINVIFGINDDSALGGLQSWRAAGKNDKDVLVVGFGFEGAAGRAAMLEGGPYKFSGAMFPEYGGMLLVNAGIMAFNGAALPKHVVQITLPMTIDLLPQYYTQEGDTWICNFSAVSKIPPEPQVYK
jgi:ribose transport system substrate-binding protein